MSEQAEGDRTGAESVTATVDRLGTHVGRSVRVQGWLMNRRSKGKLHFLIVRDGSGWVQSVAFKGNLPAAVFEALGRLPLESSLVVEGRVKQDARAPGGYELDVSAVEVVARNRRLVFGVLLDDLGNLRLQRRQPRLAGELAPGVGIHLAQLVAILAENHGISFPIYSHHSTMGHSPHSGLRALQM